MLSSSPLYAKLNYLLCVMCMANRSQPNAKSFLTNLKVSMPMKKKIWLIIRNSAIKIFTLKNCCGHPGEPGC
jgi:hypothetical protein